MARLSGFDEHHKSMARMQRVFWVIFSVVALGISAYWAAILWAATSVIGMAADQDFSGGVKPVIEQLWCGEAGCLAAAKETE